MATLMMVTLPMVVTIHRLLQPIAGRTSVQLRERIQLLVPFVLALAFVVVATLGYLELVALLLEFIE